MYDWYVESSAGPKLPTFGMTAEGFTLGNPEVPGFTYNNTTTGASVTAQPPSFGVITKPPSGTDP